MVMARHCRHVIDLTSSSGQGQGHVVVVAIERVSVTIFFLSHVFFLVSIVCHPYFCFAPLYEETDFYLLAFLSHSVPFIVPL